MFLLCAHKVFSGVDATSVMLSLMGIMFIVIGNYLPKVKRNSTIGIKVNWTLKNEENWNATHRLAGKLWFVGGVIMLATMFMKQKLAIVVFFTDMAVMVIWPIVYSYNYHKKQLANGEINKEDFKLTEGEKRMNGLAITVVIASLVLVAALMFVGDYSVTISEGKLSIDANFWSDAKINISDIESVELRESDNIGSRTFGYGTPGLYMGEFLNDEYGDYVRYSRGGCEANIVIYAEGKIYVINEKSVENTKEIYAALVELTNE